MGFLLVVEDVEDTKRNGKRVMKVRAGDELVAICAHEGHLAMFTRQASGLCIKASEIPERGAGATGVILLSVRDDDELVAAISFPRTAKFLLNLSSGREKEIKHDELLAGHRALKGNKVVSGKEILGVKRI